MAVPSLKSRKILYWKLPGKCVFSIWAGKQLSEALIFITYPMFCRNLTARIVCAP